METVRILNYEEIKRAIIHLVEVRKREGHDTVVSCNLPQFQLLRDSDALRLSLKQELRRAGYSCREFISLDDGERVLVVKW